MSNPGLFQPYEKVEINSNTLGMYFLLFLALQEHILDTRSMKFPPTTLEAS